MLSLSKYDIVNFIFALIGLAGAFQQAYSVLHARLPTQKLAILNKYLAETTDLFQSVVEEGVLNAKGDYIQNTEKALHKIYDEADSLRAKTHAARTWTSQVRCWVTGLSRRISRLTYRIMIVRADIATISEEERRRLESENPPASSSSVPFDLARHRRPKKSSDVSAGYMARHPVLGRYLIQDVTALDNLNGHAAALRAAPPLPREVDIRQLAVDLGSETLKLSFPFPEESSNGVPSKSEQTGDSVGTTSATEEHSADQYLAHILEEFGNKVDALSAAAHPLIHAAHETESATDLPSSSTNA
ncbi:hypothetical protein NM688_g77 [Phlebia brevispora]|uniref:Uncharacterized protein n=1 Tax=Phlebia brevispora TaxID=194682 RepID=A0ACC1TG37_9APHY|nr:hypothetical protein NM688_g77 [Phlebia brevispora]